jgi:hypothetical protein
MSSYKERCCPYFAITSKLSSENQAAMSSPTPCPCIFLQDDQYCYDCFVGVWNFYVTSCCKKARAEYELLYPSYSREFTKCLETEIAAAAFAAAWKNHQNQRSGKTDTNVIKKAVAEATELFMFERCRMLRKYIIPTITAVFPQHFIWSTEMDGMHEHDYETYGQCEECYEDARYRLFVPTIELRDWIKEMMLGFMTMYHRTDKPAEAITACFYACRLLLHDYMDADTTKKSHILTQH